MVTKYDIGDKVIVRNAFICWKLWPEAEGTVESIRITRRYGAEYYIQFICPEGAEIRGTDVSGMPAVNEDRIKEEDIIRKLR